MVPDNPARNRPPRLLDQVREQLRVRHYAASTEKAYLRWIVRFIRFHGTRHPRTLGTQEVEAFLRWLATERKVSASTQNQALAALLFLYRHVLDKDLERVRRLVRAKRPEHLPVVLSRTEVAALFRHLNESALLPASLMYGSGLRLMECLRLRVKDLDLEGFQLTVRRGKGAKDRVSMIPRSLVPQLRPHLERTFRQHQRDLAQGAGWVALPGALDRKLPSTGRD